MKPMNSFKKSLLALCLLTISACSALPFLHSPSTSTHTLQASGNTTYQARQKALWQQFQNKPAYIGPIKIAIHTDLLNPGQSGKQHVDLTDKLNPQGFRIQGIPQGPVLFQETFTKGPGQYEVFRGVQAANTSVRYTLHVETKSKKGDGQITVNINGTDWIKAGDFKGKEVEVNTLLLNANNSLRVRIQGPVGSSYTVSLVKGGEPGTILRRRGHLRQSDENQATHIRQNDTNIW